MPRTIPGIVYLLYPSPARKPRSESCPQRSSCRSFSPHQPPPFHPTVHSPTSTHSTGVTGYIAGDALVSLHKHHPEYSYACLVRTQEKADRVKAAFPNARIVLGDLDDSALLEREAAWADIVLRKSPTPFHSTNNTS